MKRRYVKCTYHYLYLYLLQVLNVFSSWRSHSETQTCQDGNALLDILTYLHCILS